MKKQSFFAIAAITLSSFALTSCDSAQLQGYVKEFDASVSSAKGSIKTLYLETNDVLRELYIDEIRFTTGSEVHAVSPTTSRKTDLIKHYSDDYIKARLIALDALASYTEGLAVLVLSDAPDRAKLAIQTTGKEIAELSTQLAPLTNNASLDVAKFSQPIANLSAIVAEKWLTYVRNKETRKSLIESKEQVRLICQALKDDLNEIERVVKGPNAAAVVQFATRKYNSTPAMKNGDPYDPVRTKALQDIQGTAKRFADLPLKNPALLIDRIESAHNALIDYVETGSTGSRFMSKSDENLEAELLRQLESFRDEAAELEHDMKSLLKK